MEDPRAIPGLTAEIKDGSPEVRRRAISAISNMEGGNKPVDAFIAALSDSNAEVREAAVEAISDLQDKRAVRPLIRLLSDPSADVRHQTAHALGNLEDPAAAEPWPRHCATRCRRSECCGPVAIPTRSHYCSRGSDRGHQDKNPDVRQNAIQALGQIRDPKSVRRCASH
jgi:HEAT repeat protein